MILAWASPFNWGGWVFEMPKRVGWVPGGQDKVPPMIGGAMPLLNPRWNTAVFCELAFTAPYSQLTEKIFSK